MVSVVMPAYNCEKYITIAIQAVLDQTYADFELIIINDGSTDTTRQRILSFKDSRIRYVENEENLGVVQTLNRGLDLARGKYIMRTDADDQSMPHMINSLLSFLENHPDHILCGAYVRLIGSKKLIPKPAKDAEIKIYTLLSCPFPHTCIMIRKECLDTWNLKYSTHFIDAEDHGLWSEMLLHGKFANLKKVLLFYNKSNAGQVTAQPGYRKNYLQSREKLHAYHAEYYFDCRGKDIDRYVKLATCVPPASLEELQQIRNFMQIIEKQNKLKGIFNQRLLRSFLFSRWHYICINSYHLGMEVFGIYIKELGFSRNFYQVVSVVLQLKKLIFS